MNQINIQHKIPEGIKNIAQYNNLKRFLDTGDYKYIRTVVRKEEKIGRNDLCICGSGKKFKKCCGR